jgi:hypothetical protein
MSEIMPFSGNCLNFSEVVEPQTDFEALADEQGILLEKWLAFGEEVRRRVDNLPPDLRFELCELLRETRSL